MELFKIIIVFAYTLFLYYRIGVLFKKIVKSDYTNLSTTILYGFILNFAIFEIINIPFIFLWKNSTNIMYYIFILLNIIYITLSYLIDIKEKKYNLIENIKKIKLEKNITIVFWILAIFTIGFQIFHSTFSFKQDADDAFYITWANEARELEDMYNTDPSTGLENSTFDNKYLLNTWEIYGGFTARIFNLSTPTLFHAGYQIIYIIIAYISYYLVLKKVLKKENIGLAVLILSILFLFSGVSARFKGMFLLGRIYQGKAIILNIIIPFILYKFSDYKNFRTEDYVILSLTYLASIACNPITVWLISIIYGLNIIIILLNKDFKTFKKSMILLIPIFVVCMLFLTIVMTKQTGLQNLTKSEEFNQLEDLKGFIGYGKSLIILYIISILIIFIKGNKLQKNLFIYFPILVCVLVLNPLLKDIYIKVVTCSTYWRLYWLIPIELSIVVASMIIYNLIENKKYKYIYIISIIIILMISGKYIYKDELGFSEFVNFKKIPQYIIDEVNYISNDSTGKVKTVMPNEPWESCMVRQYNSSIAVMHSRDINNQEDSEYKKLYLSIYCGEGMFYNNNEINEIIDKFNIDYIILPKNRTLQIDNTCNFTLEMENEKNYLLKVMN